MLRPAVQRVDLGSALSWTVIDAEGLPIAPVELWLEHLRVTNAAPNTVRSYAKGLALWWLFLDIDGLDWRAVGLGDVASFLSWMRYRDPDHPPAEGTLSARLAAVVAFYRFHEAFSGVAVAQHLHKVAGHWRGPGRGVLAHLENRATASEVWSQGWRSSSTIPTARELYVDTGLATQPGRPTSTPISLHEKRASERRR